PAHRAARHPQAFAPHLSPHLPWPIHLEVFRPDPADHWPQFVVTLGASGPSRRIMVSRVVKEVRRRGDRQHGADRLDPVGIAVVVDEGHHHLGRRSSSACAKNADAFRKISLARFSSRFSRSRSFSRCRSSVVKPARCPVSRSAWRTPRRGVSVVHPSLPAIDAIAAHCEECSAPCSRTIRTARSRTSGEYFVGRPMGSILSTNGPSDNPGTIHGPN